MLFVVHGIHFQNAHSKQKSIHAGLAQVIQCIRNYIIDSKLMALHTLYGCELNHVNTKLHKLAG